jgi:uncharacterized protein (TIGR03435 family)
MFMRSQIVGGPSWIDNDHFDVEAKPEGDARQILPEQMQLMVQSLLEDRFQLKAHPETRELSAYNLVVAKPGKMVLSRDQSPVNPQTTPPPRFDSSTPSPRGTLQVRMSNSPAGPLSTLVATAIPLTSLVEFLQSQTGRAVLDKTALSGFFDIQLQFTPENLASGPSTTPPTNVPAPEPSGRSLLTAIQDELGLKLEPTKAPVQVIVVDSVQRPSEN